MTTHSGPVIYCGPWRKPTLRELNRRLSRTRKQRHELDRQNTVKRTGRETI